MKTGRSITELAQELDRQQKSKRDFLADTRNLRMPLIADRLEIGDEGFPLTDLCHGQIASRLNIPMKYYKVMQNEAPGLLATNVNHWFEHNPERRMVRTLDGRARAFLSERYRPLDNTDLCEAVLPKVTEMACKIMSCEITETRLYLKVVTERITAQIVGDIVQAGLVISNSEVGCGSVKVEPLLYTLGCLNGMIVADRSMRKYHIGGRDGAEEGGASEYFKTETRIQSDKAFWMKVQDVVAGALDEVKFRANVQRLEAAKDKTIEKPLEKTVELTAAKFEFSEKEQGSVLRHLIEGRELNAYGLANAVTRMSQEVTSYDRATDYERIGGQIIEMPKMDWAAIAAA